MKSPLEISLNPPSLKLDGQPIAVTQHWLNAIAYLALRSLENNPICTPEELCTVIGWNNKPSSNAVSIIKFHQKYPNFIVASNGAISKHFRLSQHLQPVFLEDHNTIRTNLLQPQPNLLNPNSIDARASIAIGILWIERGELQKAISTFETALGTKTALPERLEMLAWLARAQEFGVTGGNYQASEKTLTQLETEIRTAKRKNQVFPSTREAMLHIQRGRIHFRKGEYANAETQYLKAVPLLRPNDNLEHGALQNGFGRIAQERKSLDQAFNHYQSSAQHYAKGNWLWGMQAALNDCGVICIQRYENIIQNQPKRAKKHLEQAAHYLGLCQQICSAANLGQESCVLEINLAQVAWLRDDKPQALHWIEVATDLNNKTNNNHDKILIHAMYGTILEPEDKAAAFVQYQQALELAKSIKNKDMIREMKRRLESN
jgi:hypothetical protein